MTADYNFVARAEVRVPEPRAGARRRDEAPARRHVAHAVRASRPRRRARNRSASCCLRGESANAGRLVTLLEESKLFVEAAPRSPTTKIQPGPGEIFDLGAQVAPIPPPPPLQIASTSAEVPAPGTPPPATPPPPAAAPAPPTAAATTPAMAPATAPPNAAATPASPQAAAPAPPPASAAPPLPAQVVSPAAAGPARHDGAARHSAAARIGAAAFRRRAADL